MLNHFLILLLFLTLITESSAQNDHASPETDTVILIKEPVVVKRKVLIGYGSGSTDLNVRTTVNNTSAAKRYSLFAGISGGKIEFKIPLNDQKEKASEYFQIISGATLHGPRFMFSLGIGTIRSAINYSVYSEVQLTKPGVVTIYDYSNASTIILPGRILFEGVVAKDSNVVITYAGVNEIKKKAHLYYLQIPFSSGYRINLENRKWYILPSLELTTCIRLNKSRVGDIAFPESIFFMYGGRLGLGYDILNKLSVLASVRIDKSINSFSLYPDKSAWTLNGAGLIVSYFLN